MNTRSTIERLLLFFALGTSAAPHTIAQAKQVPKGQPALAGQLFTLANQARIAAGVGVLAWDEALADSALKHCRRMAVEGPIAHRYDGEPDLTARAGAGGAHFSVIEENIAVGSDPVTIHQGWLDSTEHRANLLNPVIDHVGIAVLSVGGLIFAVADYSQAVPTLSQPEVEAKFAALLRAQGIMVMRDTTEARTYCASNDRYHGGDSPSFLFRWQNPDVTQLPGPVLEQLAVGRYHRAAVGSCAPQDVNGAFTIYRVAVLLY
jgi:uncharacterized protein YkwD